MGDFRIKSELINLDEIRGRGEVSTEVYKSYSVGENEYFDKEVRQSNKFCRVFNDNNATTEDATITSIKAINEKYFKKPIIIIGGVDKGLPISALENAIKENTKAVIYLAGTGTDTITLPKEYLFEKLEDCIKKAFELAEEEDVILFSPAFASYSKYFNNEYERNDLFVKEIQKYK